MEQHLGGASVGQLDKKKNRLQSLQSLQSTFGEAAVRCGKRWKVWPGATQATSLRSLLYARLLSICQRAPSGWRENGMGFPKLAVMAPACTYIHTCSIYIYIHALYIHMYLSVYGGCMYIYIYRYMYLYIYYRYMYMSMYM